MPLDSHGSNVTEAIIGPKRNVSCFVPCASDPGRPWQVIHAYPQQERAIEHRIRTQGGVAWFPMESVKLANRQTVIRGIFNRYLFSQDWEWPVIRNAGGEEMGRVLRSTSGRPLLIPPREMAGLFVQCGPNGIIVPPKPREVTRKDVVRVADGPFTGFTGICQRTTRDRVWILLSLFGRQSEVPFTRGQVELV